ncbi:MAG TPA: Na+/H+ antiporter [Candidatus Limnocylindria bacterium]|jgi:CPA1 family monovalent cation:H+ antiporter|nr:Na+/H+ antiporter [Candidatus Limnocylindria bacterium]
MPEWKLLLVAPPPNIDVGGGSVLELLLGVLLLVALLTVVAGRIGIPYPILMTLGGLLLSLVPNLPRLDLGPDLVFLLILPPLLFGAAFFTSARELWRNARPIGLLAIGLVLATTVAVAVVVHAMVPTIGWAAAFALGAIVSPPDAVAATAIAQRLGLPPRLVTIIEGESLVNDATALVVLRLAVVAVGTGTFSLGEAAMSYVWVSVGGVLTGLVVGWLVVQIEARLTDPPVEVLLSLLAPIAAWLPAEQLGVSGVLSVVTAGIVLGRAAPRVMSSDTRVLGSGVWQMLVFTVNGLVFVLIGLQLPTIIEVVSANASVGQVLLEALAVCVTVIVVRMMWVFPATYLPRWLIPALRKREPSMDPRLVTILGWSGMRGVVSLAAALALPNSVPFRDLLLFLTFSVILATLVGQGLTLPFLIRRLGVGDDGSVQHEEIHAREASVEAALGRLEELELEWPGHLELIEQLRARYTHAEEHLEHDHEAEGLREPDQEQIDHEAIRRSVIDSQRVAIIDLRDRGIIGDAALRRVERDLDLEELRAEG